MRALAVVVAVSALVVTASASAKIVPQQGIAGVRLGMSQAKVRAVLGRPASRKHGTNDFGAYTTFRYAGLAITFQGNAAVTSMSTTRRSEKTASGVGVGSTEAQVRARVSGVTCKTEFGSRHCYLGAFLVGHRVTDFFIKRGRVTRVNVGRVLD
jgi:outer membrane protein assembly factor BamE (lipoprotein component of BamABCDE complex)